MHLTGHHRMQAGPSGLDRQKSYFLAFLPDLSSDLTKLMRGVSAAQAFKHRPQPMQFSSAIYTMLFSSRHMALSFFGHLP
jgi:hypothetical protein